jgi:Mn2+/Fe2+ NRAMP family transporter
MLGRRKDVMGAMVNPRWLSLLVGVLASLIIALNVFLLQQVFFA